MIKMIDEIANEPITGYSYTNETGDIETVEKHSCYPDIIDIKVDGDKVSIFVSDVPKLIKALTLAAKL